jgi:ribosome biogenesis GTPase
MSPLQKAQIVSSHGTSYTVECADRHRLIASTRGKKTTFACGDWVEIRQLNQAQAIIEKLLPRQTLLYRSDTFRAKLIAANVTQILIVVAPRPRFTDDLIARSLIAAEDARIKPIIILNKTDLPETQEAHEKLQFYYAHQYPVIALSAHQDISALIPLLQGEVSVLVGQSGMGKSTILNTLLPEVQARVNDISVALDSGKHTTTHASLFHLNEHSALIDSPGLQSFGLSHLVPAALIHLMPDLRPYIGQCRFHNCQHRFEPNCAIQLAIAEGKVQAARLALYLRLQDELAKKYY